MDPTVVTIFCCGTAFHRDRIDFSVPFTWRATKGDRVWINDGPGNTTHHILKTENIMKRAEKGNFMPEAMFSNMHTTSRKQLTGTGTQDNIITTLQWLWMEYHRTDKPKFRTINLVGWSRGAVTCIMLAHAIEAAGFRGLLPNLKVNIFAFDPVPGGLNDFDKNGDFQQTGRAGTVDTLSPCVNEYHAILAENVGGAKGLVFKCVSPNFSNGGGTKSETPMPGGHSTVANHDTNNPVGRIAIALCHEFLTKHGTDLHVHKKLSDQQMIDLYADALLEHGEFKKKGWINRKKVFEKSTAAKVRAPLVRNDLRRHDFFINQHHADLFSKHLPTVFTKMSTDTPIDQAEQNKLASVYGRTWDALRTTGYLQ